MFEKREDESENKEWVIKMYALHLELQKRGIMGETSPCRQRIELLNNLEQLVMFWLISKNLVEL